jgi:hypothetical protein
MGKIGIVPDHFPQQDIVHLAEGGCPEKAFQ